MARRTPLLLFWGILASLALVVSVNGDNPKAFTAVPNTDYPGNTLRVLSGGLSAELCGLQCLLDGDCRMFEVIAANRTCVLKSQVAELKVTAKGVTSYVPSGCRPESNFLCKLLNATSCANGVLRSACPCTCLGPAGPSSPSPPPRMAPPPSSDCASQDSLLCRLIGRGLCAESAAVIRECPCTCKGITVKSRPPPVSRPSPPPPSPPKPSPPPRPVGCDSDMNAACKIFGKEWCPFISQDCPCLCSGSATSPAAPKPPAIAPSPKSRPPPKLKPARRPKPAHKQSPPPKPAPPPNSPPRPRGCVVETTLACQLLDKRFCVFFPTVAKGCPCKCTGKPAGGSPAPTPAPPSTSPPPSLSPSPTVSISPSPAPSALSPSPPADGGTCPLCLTITRAAGTFGGSFCDAVNRFIARLNALFGAKLLFDTGATCVQTPTSVKLCVTRTADALSALNGVFITVLVSENGLGALLANETLLTCGGAAAVNITSGCPGDTFVRIFNSFKLPCKPKAL